MQFNEYIPQGGWLKFNDRRRAKAARKETLANAAISTAIIAGLVAAYWLVAVLELA